MKQLQWGDMLCGVEVTPESWTHNAHGGWAGGAVIEFTCAAWGGKVGSWEAIEYGIGPYCRLYNSGDNLPPDFYNKLRQNYRPAFPPAGWAGKTDAELMDEIWPKRGMLNVWSKSIAAGDWWEVWCTPAGEVSIAAGRASLESHGWDQYTAELEDEQIDPAALILALQNAQVLAARLRP